MNTYTNIFGGENIDPSSLSYIGYTLSANKTLVWPFEALDGADVAAAKIDVNATVGSLTISLPDARLTSTGKDVLFNNTGANAFTVLDSDGNTIINVQPGLQWFVYLINNSTAAGTWKVVQFGAATSSANASALAGAGLLANITVLDQNLVTVPLNASYAFTQNDRARVFRNGSGIVTYTFASAATLGNGWFAYIINGGSGIITLDPSGAETIDGAATKLVSPTESLIVFSDGSNLWTLGYGRALTANVTGAAINIAGSGSYSLSSVESLAQVQDFSGALTGARTVLYGTSVGYWFVYNNTSGAFATTFKTNGADPGVIVTQGTWSILRSNGTNMRVAFTATSGTVTQVDTAAGELTGGPITSTGTVGLANTAVVPGSYGGTGLLVAFQVDAKGRLTSAAQAQLNIKDSAACTSAQLAAVISDETGSGLLVFNSAPVIDSPALTGNPTAPTASFGDADTTVANTAFVAAAVADRVASTGDVKDTFATTAPSGWIFVDGKTIGSAASGATGRANADTQALYALFWNGYADSLCPVSGGRGASAAADFAANKTLTIPDARGRVSAAADAMGGSAAGRLGSGPTGGVTVPAVPGTSGGEQSHVQTSAELAAHSHNVPGNIQSGNDIPGGGSVVYAAALVNDGGSSSTGSGTAANVTQPTLVLNRIVKL